MGEARVGGTDLNPGAALLELLTVIFKKKKNLNIKEYSCFLRERK